MLRALIVAHGDLAATLLQTAEAITGPMEGVETLSNRGFSRDALVREVEVRLRSWGDDPGVVLTDLLGGSCTQAAWIGVAARRGTTVVTGLNLAMLVDFLVNRDRHDADAMAARLVEKGRAGVCVVAPPADAPRPAEAPGGESPRIAPASDGGTAPPRPPEAPARAS